MAISYINTTEVELIAKEINSLASEFQTEINNLFKRFSEVPVVTKEWTGDKSKFYFDTVEKDKQKYIDFANSISNLGLTLNNNIYEITSCINKSYNDEQKGN